MASFAASIDARIHVLGNHLSRHLGLTQIPAHTRTIVLSVIAFQTLETLAHPLSLLLLRSAYRNALTLRHGSQGGGAKHSPSISPNTSSASLSAVTTTTPSKGGAAGGTGGAAPPDTPAVGSTPRPRRPSEARRVARMSRRTKTAWAAHVVSLAHALVIVPLALAYLFNTKNVAGRGRDEDHEAGAAWAKAFGWDPRAGDVFGVAVGYFIWDLIHEIRNYTDFGFVAHALVCLGVYANAFRPFLAYYGCTFLLWEISTPFLNVHWFMDKLGMTGSLLQLVNGAVLLLVFFGARILYGGYMSYDFYKTMVGIRTHIPAAQFYGYLAGNLTLNLLNWIWFFKMINALQRRFGGKGKAGTGSSPASPSKGSVLLNGNGINRQVGSSDGALAEKR